MDQSHLRHTSICVTKDLIYVSVVNYWVLEIDNTQSNIEIENILSLYEIGVILHAWALTDEDSTITGQDHVNGSLQRPCHLLLDPTCAAKKPIEV